MNRTASTIYGIILCLLLVYFLERQAFSQANTKQTKTSPELHAMGSSPCAEWVPDGDPGGSLDISGKVKALQSDGFRCEVFIIESSSPVYTYGNFQKLLEATRDTNIETWVVIVPPAEDGAKTLPYRTDYVAWARALAKLSLKYKNFRGFNIDDYISGVNGDMFTKSYGCEIYSTKNEVNPHFLFVPTIYNLDRTVADRLAGCVDGVWLWWTNLESSDGLQSLLEDSRYIVNGRFPVYGGVYAGEASWHSGPLNPEVFQRSLENACKYSDGAVLYQLSLSSIDPVLAVAKTFLPGGSSKYAGKCGLDATAGSDY